jgi:hypothetical protein
VVVIGEVTVIVVASEVASDDDAVVVRTVGATEVTSVVAGAPEGIKIQTIISNKSTVNH